MKNNVKDFFSKFNLRDKKYGLPLFALPFLLLICFFIGKEKKSNSKLKVSKNISMDLGLREDLEILEKGDAYKKYRDLAIPENGVISDIEIDEVEKSNIYDDGIFENENRQRVDSLVNVNKNLEVKEIKKKKKYGENYVPNNDDEIDKYLREALENQKKIADNLNNKESKESIESIESKESRKEESLNSYELLQRERSEMRKNIILLDSLQRANSPENIERAQKQKQDSIINAQIDYNKNSTLITSKNLSRRGFNTSTRNSSGELIKAIVEEDTNGRLGSRIKFKVLDDIFIGDFSIKSGQYLYGNITSFTQQRVMVTIESVLINGSIYPINLSLYDTDGMEGFYVPMSTFVEIKKELSDTGLQGTSNLNIRQGDFLTNLSSDLLSATTQTLAKVIRKQKAKIKYSSFIYLVDKRTLQDKRDRIYKQNKS